MALSAAGGIRPGVYAGFVEAAELSFVILKMHRASFTRLLAAVGFSRHASRGTDLGGG